MSLSLNDLMSDRSRNSLDDSSLSKHTNTDPWNGKECVRINTSNLELDTYLKHFPNDLVKIPDYLELLLQGSPHLNVFHISFPIQPLLDLIQSCFKRKTFLERSKQFKNRIKDTEAVKM